MFPIVDISGSPHERGRQYGGVARERILRSIDSYSRLFAYCGVGWKDVQARAQPYRDEIAKVSPSLIDEIRGIAEGAGLAESEIMALNARTELLPPTHPAPPSPDFYIVAANRAAGVGVQYDWGECTALAVLPAASREGRTWLAQNWDWIGEQRAALVVLRITDENGRQRMTLTEAGMLAKIGLNDRGFGVCLNILRSVDDGRKPGLPVHVLLRHLLECGSVDEACAVAQSITHGASSNVLIGDAAGHAASLELSPRGVAILRPANGTLAHTNHYLDASQAQHAATLSPIATTEQRLLCARRYTSQAAEAKLGFADIEALLRDESQGVESVCRHPDPALPPEVRVESVAGVIMDLAAHTMWIAPDVPSKVDFHPVSLVSPLPSN
ncbi:MAG: C45 family peptidase [Casimicrobiaceae bacterium]